MSEARRVTLCVPFWGKPNPRIFQAIEASLPLLRDAGWEVNSQVEVNNPYISSARNMMLRRALDWKSDAIVFIDHDLTWEPDALLRLLEPDFDVVCGTYRFKKDDEEYMGVMQADLHGQPQQKYVGRCNDPYDKRFDGGVLAHCCPAGFLKISAAAVAAFMRAYPALVYGQPFYPLVDLFNHGAHQGMWYGEDYAFCRNWRELGGQILLLPNLTLTHWDTEDRGFVGNFHWYMARRAGGALATEDSSNAEHQAGRGGVQRSAA